MNKVNPHVLLLCSMIDIGNHRLEELAFNRCHSIDLTFCYIGTPYRPFIRRFCSHVMPRISHHIQSLTINLSQISYIKTFAENNFNGTFPNLTHLKIMLGVKQAKTGIPYTSSQLHSFTVTIGNVLEEEPSFISKIRSISCPNLTQMTITMYRNFNNYEPCIFLLQRLVNVEYLTLLLAIGVQGTTPHHFIDGFFLERNILSYMPRLRQFNYHIRSILKNASHITIDQIRQSFFKHQHPFDCVLDNFNNNYGQCQIYSIPFIGTRLDFVSNRFPLFDINKTFSNVTILLLFDDIKPFESVFFERVARALPRLRTLEIFNQLEQQEKTTTEKINIDFAHLTVLILNDIHMDYAQQFLCQIYLPSLIELAINKDILLTIIDQNQQQARDNCCRVGTLLTSEPFYESIDIIENFFPLAYYGKHSNERKQ
ncbi:unnamed protein product [Rotaria sordida]|uniref:Uncharacterized protein n=3 Tax=Rotaria sordida TaxID=392033 RepID=A0A814PUT2_9BILA|nr:unnamed protein product [Rotaria sordida]